MVGKQCWIDTGLASKIPHRVGIVAHVAKNLCPSRLLRSISSIVLLQSSGMKYIFPMFFIWYGGERWLDIVISRAVHLIYNSLPRLINSYAQLILLLLLVSQYNYTNCFCSHIILWILHVIPTPTIIQPIHVPRHLAKDLSISREPLELDPSEEHYGERQISTVQWFHVVSKSKFTRQKKVAGGRRARYVGSKL